MQPCSLLFTILRVTTEGALQYGSAGRGCLVLCTEALTSQRARQYKQSSGSTLMQPPAAHKNSQSSCSAPPPPPEPPPPWPSCPPSPPSCRPSPFPPPATVRALDPLPLRCAWEEPAPRWWSAAWFWARRRVGVGVRRRVGVKVRIGVRVWFPPPSMSRIRGLFLSGGGWVGRWGQLCVGWVGGATVPSRASCRGRNSLKHLSKALPCSSPHCWRLAWGSAAARRWWDGA